jgi:hypothetical protein
MSMAGGKKEDVCRTQGLADKKNWNSLSVQHVSKNNEMFLVNGLQRQHTPEEGR